MNEKTVYKILIIVQDHCSISNEIKKEFNIDILNNSSLQDIGIQKLYPTREIIEQHQIVRVPTTIITSHTNFSKTPLQEIKIEGFITKQLVIKHLSELKKGNNITNPIKY